MSLGLTFNPHSPNCEILWHLVASYEIFYFVFVLKSQPANSEFDEQHFNGICYMELLRNLLVFDAYHLDYLEIPF